MKMFRDVENTLIDGIDNLIGAHHKVYACNLYNEVFNCYDNFIYYTDAKATIAEIDVWKCIGVVQRYEKEYFGGVNTDLSDACDVANMVLYIMGGELLRKIYDGTVYFEDKWNDELTDEDFKEMLLIAKRWLEENPDGLEKIWIKLINA